VPVEIAYHWHDVTTGLPRTYDAIVMNPPFHTGQATDVDLGRAFLKVAAASLNRGGKLLLVANRQLPYEAALETSGLAWRKIAENKIYKLLFAERR
jgi:16S rRNA (guanine1207-N2)-methyltransferase